MRVIKIFEMPLIKIIDGIRPVHTRKSTDGLFNDGVPFEPRLYRSRIKGYVPRINLSRATKRSRREVS